MRRGLLVVVVILAAAAVAVVALIIQDDDTQTAAISDGLSGIEPGVVADSDRVLAADGLAEVPRGRQLMMHPPGDDEERRAAGFLRSRILVT